MKGRSVPCRRVTSNAIGVSSPRHSSWLFTILGDLVELAALTGIRVLDDLHQLRRPRIAAAAVPDQSTRDISKPEPPKTDIVNIVRRFMTHLFSGPLPNVNAERVGTAVEEHEPSCLGYCTNRRWEQFSIARLTLPS